MLFAAQAQRELAEKRKAMEEGKRPAGFADVGSVQLRSHVSTSVRLKLWTIRNGGWQAQMRSTVIRTQVEKRRVS